jgi:hypothetical protein
MIYEKNNIKQLKLVTGEEIICEILEEDDVDVVLRNVLKIEFYSNGDGSRTWSFNYFMCAQDDPDKFTLIRSDKVVGVSIPPEYLLSEYYKALSEMMRDFDGDYLNDDNESYMKEMLNQDSDRDNVIDFAEHILH